MTEDESSKRDSLPAPDQETVVRRLKGSQEVNPEPKPDDPFVPRIRWPDLIAQLFIHVGCLYGLYLSIVSARVYTWLFGEFLFLKNLDCS